MKINDSLDWENRNHFTELSLYPFIAGSRIEEGRNRIRILNTLQDRNAIPIDKITNY